MWLLDVIRRPQLEEIKRLKSENQAKAERIEGLLSSINTLSVENSELSKYRHIVDVESHIEDLKSAAEKEIAGEKDANQAALAKESEEIERLRTLCLELDLKARAYQETIDLVDLGVYVPSHHYRTSEEFKLELSKLREKIKIEAKNAGILLDAEWRIVRKYGVTIKGDHFLPFFKFAVRLFNAEAGVCIENVRWNNILKMETRIRDAAQVVNDAFRSIRGVPLIQKELVDLRIEELHLAYDQECKKRIDIELRKQRAEELREENKIAKEIEALVAKADKVEIATRRLLEREQFKYEKAESEVEKTQLLEQIRQLKLQLEMAQMDRERALSMAQQTKKGYVYIISNIGSFGENIFKIGMSRRIDPSERVDELGDASVPFPFDIHAMIYSDNAPELEHSLHKRFEDRRVNMTTNRKEFFRVTLAEIEEAVKECGHVVEFVKIPEARAYWETVALLERQKMVDVKVG